MTAEIEIVRHPRARKARLSFDPSSGRATLTLPQRAPLKPALAWAHGQAEWLADQRSRLPRPLPFVPDTSITVADEVLLIAWNPGARRAIVRHGGVLSASGPIKTLPRRIEAWLKREALEILSRETAEFASAADVAVAQVAVGDAKRRWGSCAATGVIRYSWRLILAPGWVRRATVAHEVAHRVHMNHGPQFHALVAALLGADPTPARAWLRAYGAALHWVGRSS